MAIILKVKLEVLKKRATEIKTSISSLEKELAEIGTVVKGTKKYWEGDASNTHQKHYKTFEEDIPKIIKRLKEHPVDLLKMANLYDKTEDENKQLALKLPADIIS